MDAAVKVLANASTSLAASTAPARRYYVHERSTTLPGEIAAFAKGIMVGDPSSKETFMGPFRLQDPPAEGGGLYRRGAEGGRDALLP
jgi:hypothetical protein